MSYFPDPNFPIKNLVLKRPSKKEKRVLRALIILGYSSCITFLIWYFSVHEMGHPALFYPFTFAVLFLVSRIFFEWYNFFGIGRAKKSAIKTAWHVDILTTFCPGEPYRMVETTLLAMKNIRYDRKTIYLCDEADDPGLKEFCKTHGIVHVTRKDKSNAKAGNINNALKQASGDICLIMDPDHVPVPEFLLRVLPYFEDEKVGYVQCCQGYYNQEESPVARGACEQTYHFYGPQMMGMGTYGTAQAIGANCTFRRAALDSIGGHSAGLAEDMHTSMNLQAKGWKAVYIPEMLSRGLVPADIIAYYKQQLKWARGSFELLFERYPFLFRNFTWKQRLHHLMTPLFYLNGITTFIFLLLPALALFMSDVPVHIDFIEFAAYFLPVIFSQQIIRQYVQKWLYKPQERGFHLTGGILMAGTWWIYTIGFIYSIFRKKVPYIPTPKEGQKKNFFFLLLPNIILIIISAVSIVYGLARDWSLFSWIMAGFAGANILILVYFCLMCQQKWLIQAEAFFRGKHILHSLGSEFKIRAFRYSQVLFHGLRRSAALLAVLAFTLSFTNTIDPLPSVDELKDPEAQKWYYGGFYTGLTIHPEDGKKIAWKQIGKGYNTSVQETDLTISLEDTSESADYSEFIASLDSIRIPLINLHFKDSAADISGFLSGLKAGKADKKFLSFLSALEQHSRPVFLCLMPDLMKRTRNQYEELDYKQSWIRFAQLVYTEGINNCILTFHAGSQKELDIFFPGDDYVEWISADLDSADQLNDYSYSLSRLNKPVMFSVTTGKGDNIPEILDQLAALEFVKGIVFRIDENNMPDIPAIERKLGALEEPDLAASSFLYEPEIEVPAVPSPLLSGSPGNYTLIRNNSPFFVKGIAYNVTHDWRDPQIELTRKTLEADFALIRKMGANTIRRYGISGYDLNILNLADEADLAVMYGFWLEAETDYFRDKEKLKEYEDRILQQVRQYKDHPSILCWTIGNETWSLLKNYYGEPYLTSVRYSYIRFLEDLCRKIKAIDPVHPVLTVIEYNEAHVVRELKMLEKAAPSLDIIGLNAYYEEQLKMLDTVMASGMPEKSYIVTEFGPRGYWHPVYTRFEQGTLVSEDSDQEKSRLYIDQWKEYIEKPKGRSLGGVAYAWTDRLEGTATWYGVTDHKERLKPSFHALRHVWTGSPVPDLKLKEVSIEAEEEILIPGRSYEFHAVLPGVSGNDLIYEWQLKKHEYLIDVREGIEILNNGRSVKITIPGEGSGYRLYLYVSDGKGNVVTASKALKTDYGFIERMLL